MTTALQQLETNKLLYTPSLRYFWKNSAGEIRCSDGVSVADKLCDDPADLALLDSAIDNGDWKVL